MRRPGRNASHRFAARPHTLNRPAWPDGPTSAPARQPATCPAPEIGALLGAAVQHHQAGRLAEAEQLYRQVLALDGEQPDALHLLGVLAYQVGRPDLAVTSIERAIARRADAPGFHLNLGNAYLALGRQADAIASYRRAADLAPGDPEAHYNLGNALVASGEGEAGIVALTAATRLRPEHADAQYNLGNALRAAGRPAEAATAYRAAVRARPAFPAALTNLGTILHALGEADEALACFERAAALQPDDAGAALNLAEALRGAGRAADATSRYRQVLRSDPDDLTALRGLVETALASEDRALAIDTLGHLASLTPDDLAVHHRRVTLLCADGQAIAAVAACLLGLDRSPSDRVLLRALVDLLQSAPIEQAGAGVRAALLTVARDDTFDLQRLATPILRILAADPGWAALVDAARAGLDPFAANGGLPATLTGEPAVLATLPRVTICAPDVERVLTAVRRSVLGMHGPALTPLADAYEGPAVTPLTDEHEGPAVTPRPPLPLAGAEEMKWGCEAGLSGNEGRLADLQPFLCALAGAAFLVEHAWFAHADELTRVSELRAEIVAALADPGLDPAILESDLLVLALYEPLGRLPGAERLTAVPETAWSPSFAAVIREQVAEPLAERAIAAGLPALTPIGAGVSAAVRAMYEANPYPRWRAARHGGAETLAERFRKLCPGEPVPEWPSPTPVLVAGAGTGQHPVQTALRLPEASILAVDLSCASLAYGARMARKLGVANARFAQADILALGALDERFALIESVGVLHHMDDPLAGWGVLRGLLRPDGLMLIALYSERARADIVAARAILAEAGLPSTPEGIRAARRHLLDLPPDNPAASLVKFWDFYSASGFRDLAMHVQEHRFTVPMLADALDRLDVRFLGFELPPAVLDRFRARFPTPGAERDLACWDAYEAAEPNTFVSMYHLWCGPR